jgi:hypothetical protein
MCRIPAEAGVTNQRSNGRKREGRKRPVKSDSSDIATVNINNKQQRTTETNMSNISSVSPTTNLYSNQAGFSQSFKDLKDIGSALQSGDLSTAQSALSTFQQQLQGSSSASSSQPFGSNAQANKDYQSLSTALQSGDTKGAQQAFASLKTDLKSAQKGGHHHHHGAPPAAPATSTSSTASLVSTTGSVNTTA